LRGDVDAGKCSHCVLNGEQHAIVRTGCLPQRELADCRAPQIAEVCAAAEQVPEVIERIVRTYVDQREVNEGFLDTFQRIGLEPFKANVYSREEVA